MSNYDEVIRGIGLICTEYGMPPFTDDRLEMWTKALASFPAGAVKRAVANHIMTSQFKPQLADIVKQCQSQQDSVWMNADEAWATVPKSEQETAILTKETAEALAVAQPLLNDGDKIGARMAFKDAYSRLIEKAKAMSRKPVYFVSLGSDANSRASVLAEGVRTQKIALEMATTIAPEHAHDIVMLAGVKNHPLLAAPSAEGAQKIKQIMLMLKDKQ